MMSVFLGPIEHSSWTHLFGELNFDRYSLLSEHCVETFWIRTQLQLPPRLLVFSTTFCSLCRGPIRTFLLPAPLKAIQNETMATHSFLILYYYVSRFLKVEMSCPILRPFSLFLSSSSILSVSHSHTTLIFMHPHICSSTLQMIMCLSTAEWAVCQHRARGQCFSHRTSKAVISSQVYAHPEGRRRFTHIKFNGRNCDAQYGSFRFHLQLQ